MKRAAFLMVPLVLAFLLVACSSNTPETSAETTLPTATDPSVPQETVPEDTEPESIKLAPIIQISTNWTQVAALRSDGTVSVVAEESWSFGQCDTETWTDVIDICTGYSHTVGLRSDGTVYAAGTNSYNQCDVADWVDIVAIAAGYDFTIGLKSDGTVVATGNNDQGQCDVSGLTDIVAISASSYASEYLQSDGTWTRIGNAAFQINIPGLKTIRSVCNNLSIGIKEDGSIIGVEGSYTNKITYPNKVVDLPWTNAVQVEGETTHFLILSADGTVTADFDHNTFPYEEALFNADGECNVSEWTDIVAISTTMDHTVGLKSDGTVVSAGVYSNSDTPCDVSALNANTETVFADRIVDLSILTTYCLGDAADADHLKLRATYESGKKNLITTGYTCSISSFDQPGTQEVTISCQGFTKTFHVEVLDFYSLEATVDSISGEGYNEGRNVHWVLYIAARYHGNYVDYAFKNSFNAPAGYSGDFAKEWINAKNGKSASWYYGCANIEMPDYYAGGATILPDDASVAGDYYATVTFGDLTKILHYTLVYNGNYETGTGWSIENIQWS